MSDTEKPKIEELADELAFWKSYRETRRAKGIDVYQILLEWADEQKSSLRSPGAREDFEELSNDGCLPLALAALVALVRFSPMLEEFWIEMVGHPDNREKATRNLENAVQMLQGLFGNVIALEKEGKNPEFAKIGRLPVSAEQQDKRLAHRLAASQPRLRNTKPKSTKGVHLFKV